LPFDHCFGTSRNHLFVSAGENLDLHFQKLRKDVEGIPRRGENLAFEDFSGWLIQEN
jgi:hypothetical protein